MPSDKHNSEMANATDVISSQFNVPFANHGSSNTSIMALLILTFVVIHSFLHNHVGDDLQYKGYGFAVLARALFMLFFAWNVAQSSWKQSIVVNRDQATHLLFYW